MLKILKLKKLRNSEFIQFFTYLISILTRNKAEELRLKEQLDPLIVEVEKIKSVHATEKRNDIFDELEDIDNMREDNIPEIQTVIEGYTPLRFSN